VSRSSPELQIIVFLSIEKSLSWMEQMPLDQQEVAMHLFQEMVQWFASFSCKTLSSSDACFQTCQTSYSRRFVPTFSTNSLNIYVTRPNTETTHDMCKSPRQSGSSLSDGKSA
jgi:hypothetical protein